MSADVEVMCTRHPTRARRLAVIADRDGQAHGTDAVRWGASRNDAGDLMAHDDAMSVSTRPVVTGQPLRLDCPGCLQVDLSAESIRQAVAAVVDLNTASVAVAGLPGHRGPIESYIDPAGWVDLGVLVAWLRNRPRVAR